jgi:hypothetical protein
VNKIRTMGFLIDKNQKHKHRVLTEKLYDIGERPEHTPRNSLKRLAQENEKSKSNARMANTIAEA